ncbi:MAG: nucleoid-associated protein [Veillonellales bacterium]
MIDLAMMSIDKTIIHQVPNSLAGAAPIFSHEIIHLDGEALAALTRRVTDVMGKGSNCLEMQVNDTTDVSSVTQVISIMENSSDETFISKTISLAQKLFQSQSNNRIPEGILVSLSGRTGASQQQFIALIKAEGETGFHIQDVNQVDFLSNLFLTNAQRLYKIGFFVRDNTNSPINPNDLSIYVFDQNAVHNGTVCLANYFYQTFLGCKQLVNAAHQTETFYSSTKDFIVNNSNFTDEKKIELVNSLHTYLKSDQSAVINGQHFANTYFEDPEIIDQYTSRLTQDKLPLIAISKDISRINRKLKIRRMKFNTGVKISFPSPASGQNTDDLLVMESYNEVTDYTSLKIKGRITSQDS